MAPYLVNLPVVPMTAKPIGEFAATEVSREFGAALAASCIQIRTEAFLPAKLQTEVQWS